jgi:prolyl-tRNA synthetase
MANDALKMYNDFVQNHLGIYCVSGKKTASEKFAGANYTLTIEALMKDNKALQMGTSHQLGQDFAKSFNIQFLNEQSKKNYVWQTSWGVSTRMIGGIVMAHGDDKGLVLPPKIAPHQAVIIPIAFDSKIKTYVSKIEKMLSDNKLRFYTDHNQQQTPGWKFHEWELKGAPLRIEIGPKEVKENSITYVMRDALKRENISWKQFAVQKLLDAMQQRLLDNSRKFTEQNMHTVKSYEEFKKIIREKGGLIKINWCGNAQCEEKIKSETKATIRCIIKEKKNGGCVKCGKEGKFEVLFAKAY